MTFLGCITRIFTQMAIIRGDTDTPTSFSDTQHNASLAVGQVAVQDEIVNLISRKLLPKERVTTGVITLTTGTRVYNLSSDFTGFYGKRRFYDSTANFETLEYPGGLEALQVTIFTWATDAGYPNWWYMEPSNATLKQVGFYQVPNSAVNNRVLTYDYQASVLVANATDNLPFHNNEEAYAFTIMAGRRFKYMWEDTKAESDISMILEKDTSYREARAALYGLLKGQDARKEYGAIYR